eukprot:COSAG01_NODE_721_length_14068_cov_479.648436_10_plen_262_part_00
MRYGTATRGQSTPPNATTCAPCLYGVWQQGGGEGQKTKQSTKRTPKSAEKLEVSRRDAHTTGSRGTRQGATPATKLIAGERKSQGCLRPVRSVARPTSWKQKTSSNAPAERDDVSQIAVRVGSPPHARRKSSALAVPTSLCSAIQSHISASSQPAGSQALRTTARWLCAGRPEPLSVTHLHPRASPPGRTCAPSLAAHSTASAAGRPRHPSPSGPAARIGRRRQAAKHAACCPAMRRMKGISQDSHQGPAVLRCMGKLNKY